MRIVDDYSHLGGKEIIHAHHADVEKDINQAIGAVQAHKTKVSKEKHRKGKTLFSPSEINKSFKKEFSERGFKEIKTHFDIKFRDKEGNPQTTKGYKQVDYSKDRINVEVQFGKYAFMFYDMSKFQQFFNEDKIDAAVEIVPTNWLKRSMSSGVSYGEQLVTDIKRLRRTFPAVPVWIIMVGN